MSEKKGMPVWGWLLIGCGGIIVLGTVAIVGLGFFAVKEVQQFVEEAERNPAHGYAKILAFADDNIEIVDHNDDDQTVTIKNISNDEEVTIDLAGLEDGQISWINNGQKGSFNGQEKKDAVIISGYVLYITQWEKMDTTSFNECSSYLWDM